MTLDIILEYKLEFISFGAFVFYFYCFLFFLKTFLLFIKRQVYCTHSFNAVVILLVSQPQTGQVLSDSFIYIASFILNKRKRLDLQLES